MLVLVEPKKVVRILAEARPSSHLVHEKGT